jgi:hypothetical protein
MQIITKRDLGELYQCQAKQTLRQLWLEETEGHYVSIKVLVCQADVTIINMYAPNSRALVYYSLKLVLRTETGPGLLISLFQHQALGLPLGIATKPEVGTLVTDCPQLSKMWLL